MKKLILLSALVFSLNSFSQTVSTCDSDPVIKKTLFTNIEKEQSKNHFNQEVDKIGMSPENEDKYLAVVDKYTEKMKDINRDHNLTKSECTEYLSTSFDRLDQEVKPLLTYEQYNQHKLISNRFENSILDRIQRQ